MMISGNKTPSVFDRYYLVSDWVFQTGCFVSGFTHNGRGTARPCLLPSVAVKSKPPAVRVVVNSDLKMAARLQKEYLESATVTKSGPIVDSEEKKRSNTTLNDVD